MLDLSSLSSNTSNVFIFSGRSDVTVASDARADVVNGAATGRAKLGIREATRRGAFIDTMVHCGEALRAFRKRPSGQSGIASYW